MSSLFFSSRARTRRRSLAQNRIFRRRWYIAVASFFCFVLVAYGVSVMTHHPRFTLATIEITEGETVSSDTLEAEVTNALEGSHYLFIPKRFSFLYPHEKIMALLDKYPRIQSATVARASPTHLSIAFTEYKPDALWCAHDMDGESSCMFITRDGYAYEEAPTLSGGTFLRFYDERNLQVSPGETLGIPLFHDLEDMAYILREQYGFIVQSIRYTSAADVIFESFKGSEIRISDKKDRQQTLRDIDALLSSKEYQHLKTAEFVYLDLRFADKIFIKETDEQANASSTLTHEILPE